MRSLLEALKHALLPAYRLARWHVLGRPPPPPPEIKHKIIRSFAQRSGLRTLIETGTYHGDTIKAVRSVFDQVISIELGRELHEGATERFKEDSSVTLLLGDSGKIVPELINELGDQPALLWLDAHWSAGETARGPLDTPIVAELDAALSSNVPHVILIDDARHFDGTCGYPTIDEIRRMVCERGGVQLTVLVEQDIIRIYDPQTVAAI